MLFWVSGVVAPDIFMSNKDYKNHKILSKKKTTDEAQSEWVQLERTTEDPAGKHVDGFSYPYVTCPQLRPSALSSSCSCSFGEVGWGELQYLYVGHHSASLLSPHPITDKYDDCWT